MKNEPNNPTSFQRHVYSVVKEIPKGKVSTYSLVNKKLLLKSIKSSPRAVGQALRRNPYGFKSLVKTVPCHRVISSDLKLHGFYGKMKSEDKSGLLEEEGILFVDGKVGKEFLHYFDL